MREGGGADDPPRARASRARRSTTNPDRGRNRRGLREESDLRAASGGPGSGGRDRRGLESGTGAKGKVEKYLGAAAAAGRGGGEAKGKGGGRKGDGGGDDDGAAQGGEAGEEADGDGRRRSRAESSVWELLAELWTELTVYLAPSAGELHVKAHKEALALGGEFITVLWALCTHTATSV